MMSSAEVNKEDIDFNIFKLFEFFSVSLDYLKEK